jgi:hypothetical protein
MVKIGSAPGFPAGAGTLGTTPDPSPAHPALERIHHELLALRLVGKPISSILQKNDFMGRCRGRNSCFFFNNAGMALYQAKKAGRNRVVAFPGDNS